MNKVNVKSDFYYPPTNTSSPIKFELLCGIPGSGKSTYAAKFPNALILNRDSYRELLTSLPPNKMQFYYSEDFAIERTNYEMLITHMVNTQIKFPAPHIDHIIVDQTNLNLKLIKDFGALRPITQISVFEVELQDAINRDSVRERRVGINVIEPMYDRFQRFLPETRGSQTQRSP